MLAPQLAPEPLQPLDAPVLPVAARRPWQHWAALAVLSLAALPRLWAAIWDQSIFYPDEVFQALEQAHRFAFHYGEIPWEFRDAARSWVFPGLLGLVLKLASGLGVHHALGLVISAKLAMVALGLGGLEVARRMATRMAGSTAGLVAMLLAGACPLLIYFGARTMSEMASGPPLLLGAYLALVAERRRPALAGAATALTIFFRYQNGLVAAGYFILLLVRREWRVALRFALAGAAVALACGMLDWVTWSYPFQSFWVYVKFNLIEGKASQFGTAPFGFFAEHLQDSMGVGLGVVLLGLAASARRAQGLVLVVLVYFLVHSVVPHKELRFLMPVVPLALTLAAVGLTDLCQAWRPGPGFAVAVAACTAAAFVPKAIFPVDRDYGRNNTDFPLWHTGEDYFRTTLQAEPRADLCGIALVGNQRWWTGGYTYLHRNVPIYFDLNHLASANYVVGSPHERLPAGWKQIFHDGQYALYRRDGTCASDPGHKPDLN